MNTGITYQDVSGRHLPLLSLPPEDGEAPGEMAYSLVKKLVIGRVTLGVPSQKWLMGLNFNRRKNGDMKQKNMATEKERNESNFHTSPCLPS